MRSVLLYDVFFFIKKIDCAARQSSFISEKEDCFKTGRALVSHNDKYKGGSLCRSSKNEECPPLDERKEERIRPSR
jgi:hypothetical protein